MAKRRRDDLTMATTLADLPARACKWPVGPGVPEGHSAHVQLFCGHASEVGRPYCPHHTNCAHPPLQPGKSTR